MSAETLPRPASQVNLVDMLGRVPTLGGAAGKVAIVPGKFIEETSQMLRFLYPEVSVAIDQVGEGEEREA